MISKYVDLKDDEDYSKLEEPARAIREGKLVVLPTETVYGIGANALDVDAVKNIFEAKGRHQDNPLIVHIANIKMLDDLILGIGEIEEILINNFWPGPLTIVFDKKEIVPHIVTGGLNTVAVRMPKNEIARKLIEYANVPIAAPSANISGRPSGTLLEDIILELDGKVEYMIDGGAVDIGLESTVVRVEQDIIHILRPGKITKEEMEELGLSVQIEENILREHKPDEVVMSPGMKYKHYAPETKCLLVYSADEEKLVSKINELIEKSDEKILILAKTRNLDKYKRSNFSEDSAKLEPSVEHKGEGSRNNIVYILDMGDTYEEISKNIFSILRKIDSYKVDLAIIEGVNSDGLGLAIMNRLIKACENNYIEV